jgi:hypothetical protein
MNIKSSPLKLRFNKEVNERGLRIGTRQGKKTIIFLGKLQRKRKQEGKGRKVTLFFSDSLGIKMIL